MLEWVMDWITDATLHLAAATGLDPALLMVDAIATEQLLDLAGIAAHSSGARTNAPLLCHVIGRAVALGASLDIVDAAVREFAGSGD
ncbi:MAG TPA: DUF6457 domain-containing protein [Acidimicrobiia bacterium]|nr:DUF6457 domain-containing protein [Acidimicrobiia bacterium]